MDSLLLEASTRVASQRPWSKLQCNTGTGNNMNHLLNLFPPTLSVSWKPPPPPPLALECNQKPAPSWLVGTVLKSSDWRCSRFGGDIKKTYLQSGDLSISTLPVQALKRKSLWNMLDDYKSLWPVVLSEASIQSQHGFNNNKLSTFHDPRTKEIVSLFLCLTPHNLIVLSLWP